MTEEKQPRGDRGRGISEEERTSKNWDRGLTEEERHSGGSGRGLTEENEEVVKKEKNDWEEMNPWWQKEGMTGRVRKCQCKKGMSKEERAKPVVSEFEVWTRSSEPAEIERKIAEEERTNGDKGRGMIKEECVSSDRGRGMAEKKWASGDREMNDRDEENQWRQRERND
jgi:hypothetical protein